MSKDYQDVIRDNIYKILADKKITQVSVAKKLGKKPQYLNACLKKKKPIKNIINEIAAVLEIEVEEILSYTQYDRRGTQWQRLLRQMIQHNVNIGKVIKMVELEIDTMKNDRDPPLEIQGSSAV